MRDTGIKGVAGVMMGKSTSFPAGSAVKSRFMLITRVIGLYSLFTSLPADRMSLPSLMYESHAQMFLEHSRSALKPSELSTVYIGSCLL